MVLTVDAGLSMAAAEDSKRKTVALEHMTAPSDQMCLFPKEEPQVRLELSFPQHGTLHQQHQPSALLQQLGCTLQEHIAEVLWYGLGLRCQLLSSDEGAVHLTFVQSVGPSLEVFPSEGAQSHLQVFEAANLFEVQHLSEMVAVKEEQR
jgi:hypothetical protein